MKRNNLKILLLVIPVCFLLMLFGCSSSDNNPVETTDTPMTKPTNLQAFSKSSAEVGLTWTKSVDVNNSQFNSYILKTKSGTTIVKTEYPTKTDTTWTVTGLTEGTIYKFVLSTRTQKGTVSDSVEATWSPAKRMETDKDAVAIKLYEWNSTLPSGLDLQNTSLQAEVVQMSQSKKIEADVILDYTTDNKLELESPKIRDASFKSIRFSPTTYSVNSLDDPRASFPAESGFTSIESIFDNPQTATGKLIFAKTQEGNYNRILVISKNGNLIQGTSPNRFVEVKISYQSVKDIPYAKRAK